MKVTVRLGEPLWRAVDARRLQLEFVGEQVTVADALARLAVDSAEFAAAYRGDDLGHRLPYRLFVNARLVPPGQEERQTLGDGDTLFIFLPAAGGQQKAWPLPADFYARPTLAVARGLLGQRLVRDLDGRRLSGRIVEVEAYVGEEDRASHAAGGPTGRNRAMYGPPGRAYIYFIYGMHYCLNVVTEAAGFPAAVLIRALEPLEGVEEMALRRAGRPRTQLVNGPGKLCQALEIDRRFYGHDLSAGVALWLEPGPPLPEERVITAPRINVRGDEAARTAPWRFLDGAAVGGSVR